jgi:SRSO17 transposase
MLPELDEFLATFQVHFRRSEGKAALERYLTGLLTEVANKNCDPMAAAVPGTSEQRLQELLTNMQWDEEDLNRQRVHKMIAEATVGHGVLIFDDTGFAKQGKHSVGVARQYSGTLGKVGNCQVAVTCCYSDPQASWPVAVRLSLPREWAEEPERCRRARVPAAVPFESMENLGIMPHRASPRPPWRVSYAWRGSFGFERCVNDEGPSTEVR